MGNAISGLPPFSVTTGVIGVVSFLFTLLTAFRVFWQNLRTIAKADSEVRFFLPNLKQAIYEEQSLLRMVRRRCRSQYEEGGFRILAETVRLLLAEFQHLQVPFMDYPESSGRARRGRRDSAGSPGLRGGLRAEREKARAFAENGAAGDRGLRGSSKRHRDRDSDDGNARSEHSDDYMNIHYSARSVYARWRWLYRRSRFVELSDRLTRVQSRRTARQTTDICIDTRYVARTVNELQDRLDALERRIQRL